MEWFKTHEWGFDPSRKPTDQWASEQMFNNGKKVTFNLPTSLPGGHYIVRNEIIGELSVVPRHAKELYLINSKMRVLSPAFRRQSKRPQAIAIPKTDLDYQNRDPNITLEPFKSTLRVMVRKNLRLKANSLTFTRKRLLEMRTPSSLTSTTEVKHVYLLP